MLRDRERKRRDLEEKKVELGIGRGGKCLQRIVNVGEIGRGSWD